jgi:hypothetical protein
MLEAEVINILKILKITENEDKWLCYEDEETEV